MQKKKTKKIKNSFIDGGGFKTKTKEYYKKKQQESQKQSEKLQVTIQSKINRGKAKTSRSGAVSISKGLSKLYKEKAQTNANFLRSQFHLNKSKRTGVISTTQDNKKTQEYMNQYKKSVMQSKVADILLKSKFNRGKITQGSMSKGTHKLIKSRAGHNRNAINAKYSLLKNKRSGILETINSQLLKQLQSRQSSQLTAVNPIQQQRYPPGQQKYSSGQEGYSDQQRYPEQEYSSGQQGYSYQQRFPEQQEYSSGQSRYPEQEYSLPGYSQAQAQIQKLPGSSPESEQIKTLLKQPVVSQLSKASSPAPTLSTTQAPTLSTTPAPIKQPEPSTPHKTQLEVLTEKADTITKQSTELSKFFTNITKNNTTATFDPKIIAGIMKQAGIELPKNIRNTNSAALKQFASTPAIIKQLKEREAQIQKEKGNITAKTTAIQSQMSQLEKIQEKHNEYKQAKIDIAAKDVEINKLEAQKLLLNSTNPTTLTRIKSFNNKIAIAKNQKENLELGKTFLKKELEVETKNLQSNLSTKTVNNQIKLFEQNPEVYYGQKKLPGETEEQTRERLIGLKDPAILKLIELKDAATSKKTNNAKTKSNNIAKAKASQAALEAELTALRDKDILKPEAILKNQAEITAKEAEIKNKQSELDTIKANIASINQNISKAKETANTEIAKVEEDYQKNKKALKDKLNLETRIKEFNNQIQNGTPEAQKEAQTQKKELLSNYREQRELISDRHYEIEKFLMKKRDETIKIEAGKKIKNQGIQTTLETTMKNVTTEAENLKSEIAKSNEIQQTIETKTEEKNKIDTELQKLEPPVVPKPALLQENEPMYKNVSNAFFANQLSSRRVLSNAGNNNLYGDNGNKYKTGNQPITLSRNNVSNVVTPLETKSGSVQKPPPLQPKLQTEIYALVKQKSQNKSKPQLPPFSLTVDQNTKKKAQDTGYYQVADSGESIYSGVKFVNQEF